jgi:hypothetical protein
MTGCRQLAGSRNPCRSRSAVAPIAVNRALEPGLSDALHDAAMRLAIDQERVDDRSEGVDEAIGQDLDRAGIRANLDPGNLTTCSRNIASVSPRSPPALVNVDVVVAPARWLLLRL